MKAVFTKPTSNARNLSGKKELVSAYSVLGKQNRELQELVVARVYMGRSSNASVVYAAVWVYGDTQCSGSGSAGGYGYHKESAAIADAIKSAGISVFGSPYGEPPRWNQTEKREFTPKERAAMKREADKKLSHFGGTGDSATQMALEAIARATGAKGKLSYVRH